MNRLQGNSGRECINFFIWNILIYRNIQIIVLTKRTIIANHLRRVRWLVTIISLFLWILLRLNNRINCGKRYQIIFLDRLGIFYLLNWYWIWLRLLNQIFQCIRYILILLNRSTIIRLINIWLIKILLLNIISGYNNLFLILRFWKIHLITNQRLFFTCIVIYGRIIVILHD